MCMCMHVPLHVSIGPIDRKPQQYFRGFLTLYTLHCTWTCYLFDLACFFLPSFASLIKTCTLYIDTMYMYMYMYTYYIAIVSAVVHMFLVYTVISREKCLCCWPMRVWLSSDGFQVLHASVCSIHMYCTWALF